jgi:hypothetical protein
MEEPKDYILRQTFEGDIKTIYILDNLSGKEYMFQKDRKTQVFSFTPNGKMVNSKYESRFNVVTFPLSIIAFNKCLQGNFEFLEEVIKKDT